jgi:hypothetical protein
MSCLNAESYDMWTDLIGPLDVTPCPDLDCPASRHIEAGSAGKSDHMILFVGRVESLLVIPPKQSLKVVVIPGSAEAK